MPTVTITMTASRDGVTNRDAEGGSVVGDKVTGPHPIPGTTALSREFSAEHAGVDNQIHGPTAAGNASSSSSDKSSINSVSMKASTGAAVSSSAVRMALSGLGECPSRPYRPSNPLTPLSLITADAKPSLILSSGVCHRLWIRLPSRVRTRLRPESRLPGARLGVCPT
jgi:hypothetical protein